jgi:hypothetical protein
MKYTEKEAKALLKVLGFELITVPEWRCRPDCYFRYLADRTEPPITRFSGDTYTELLDYYFLQEKQHEQR